MYTVVFVRHGMFFLLPANVPLGESTWNKENRFCGWADKDLTEAGENEARYVTRTFFSYYYVERPPLP